MSTLDDLIKDFPLPTWRPLAGAAMALLAGGAIWAAQTRIDRVAVAQGVVAPQGQVRTVQHLEGGIVDTILVREGDRVSAGQALLQIDLGNEGLNAEEIQIRLDSLALERARLLAETLQVDLALPEAPSTRQPDLAKAERAAYQSRRREYESSLAVLRDQRSQKELAIQSINERLKAARARLAPLDEQRRTAQHLADKKLARRTEALSLEGEYQRLKGEIADLEVSLPLAQTALAEARERELYERNRFRKAANDRLREVEVDIARQTELSSRASSQNSRTVIESPIDGVVKNLAVNTIGAVVRPGDPILEVVPTRERLVVEARLSPEDVGHVQVGQRARVKLSTYDFLRYGALEGRIARIAADSNTDEQGRHFFQFVVEPEADHLSVGAQRYPLSPGMTAQVDIDLGDRSMLEYLIEPALKLRENAFRER
ncbi:MAG: HlyD family type I secretion periplasmic adaptor subunit [Pseudomonadota bacterium]